MSKKFAVVSLWAGDVPACAHFYRDVLGLSLLPSHAGRPHFDLDGVFLTILHGQPSPARESDPARFPLFAISVDDLDEMVRRLEAHGVPLPWGIEQDDSARWVMFHDPGGNLIELAHFGE